MANNFILTVPENVTSEKLRIDLDSVIRQHKGTLAFNINSSSQWGHQDIRVYEIPVTGTVTTITNERNYFEANAPNFPIGKIKYSALVACTGFDETSHEYTGLVRDILDLENRYNVLRTKAHSTF
jgi:hypothetical protein